MGLTRILANELAAHNINVNAIAPGYMETDNTTALRADAKRNAEILARIPAGRWVRRKICKARRFSGVGSVGLHARLHRRGGRRVVVAIKNAAEFSS